MMLQFEVWRNRLGRVELVEYRPYAPYDKMWGRWRRIKFL